MHPDFLSWKILISASVTVCHALYGVVIQIQESNESVKLQDLRRSIAENSRNLVDLFRERAELAREIGRVKREAGLPSRIREREETVLEGLGELDPFSRSIMSSLFEFSIINEHDGGFVSSQNTLEEHRFTLAGSRNDLEFLSGYLISRPGVDVFSENPLPEAFIEGVQANGGHIIKGDHSNPDITVCLGDKRMACDFEISGDAEMHFRLKFPVKAGNAIVRVVQ